MVINKENSRIYRCFKATDDTARAVLMESSLFYHHCWLRLKKIPGELRLVCMDCV